MAHAFRITVGIYHRTALIQYRQIACGATDIHQQRLLDTGGEKACTGMPVGRGDIRKEA
ncbi:hypothetical protein GALL_477320 [mine drainage metagenome]|uniref:Uncharacterized protein n=1 Tax=mine drainage metagenome TaxID=410659 RepID=A0A1J5PSS8_9ZZZZ